MRRLSIVASIIVLACLLALPARAAGRIALVIGNSTYEHLTRLENPVNDARLIATTLGGLGFELIGDGPQLDLDKSGLDSAVQQFGRRIQGAEVALFYYAGHGVQLNGRNFLIPVGANPVREADADFQMLDANLVLRQMEGSGSALNLLILDACRNNPFGGRGMRSAGAGLAQMKAPEGTLISFATQPGNVALDGEGGNSPYSRALADTIARPGLDIFRVFNEIGLNVDRSTAGAQQPWMSASPISGEFFFAGRGDGAPPPPAQNGDLAALQERLKQLERQLEEKAERERQLQEQAKAQPPEPPRVRSTQSWDHNGSVMSLNINGPSMEIRYARPSSRMRRAVSLLDNLLFIGTDQGGRYEGTAYVYSSKCRRKFGYQVSGDRSGGRIELRGAAPVVQNCRVTGYAWNSNSVLVFNAL